VGVSRERQRAEELVGKTISDRYRIDSLIAAGGMGAVFRGEHLKMRKRVAIKVLHAELEGLVVLKEQFEREAIAGAHITHPNVAIATDFGELDDGSYFLVLEYVKGQTLAELLESGPLPADRAVGIAKQIAAALQACHELDVIHRDVKSQNVMLIAGSEDLAKLIDFGFAKVKMERMSLARADDPLNQTEADPDTVFGTIAYLAPEAVGGNDALDARSDLYALGVIMYEMLTGKRPFEGASSAEVFKQHRETPPPPFIDKAPMLPVPASIEALVMRLLAKDPDARFQSGAEVIAALDRALAGRARAPSQAPQPVELPPDLDAMIAQRKRWPKIVIPLVLIASAAGAVWFVPSVRDQLRDVGVPIPADFGASAAKDMPQEVGGKGASAWTAALMGAPASKDWAGGVEALAALQQLDPTALAVDGVAEAAQAVAIGASTAKRTPPKAVPTAKAAPTASAAGAASAAVDGGDALDVFALLAQGFGTDGPEVLWRIAAATPPSHPAHKRAYGELRQPQALGRATPALQIAVKLRDAPCEQKAGLLRRAREVGDARALAELKPLRRHPCRTAKDPCCFRKNPALESAITSIETRLGSGG
jgi:eukaryotic-like serine/threonine-protein kinase